MLKPVFTGPRANVTRDLFAQDNSLFNRCLDSVVRCPVHGIDARTIAKNSCWSVEQERLIRDHGASDPMAARMIREAVPVLRIKLANKGIALKHEIQLVQSRAGIDNDPFWSSFVGMNTSSARTVWMVLKTCCKENLVVKNKGHSLPFTKAVLGIMNTVKG